MTGWTICGVEAHAPDLWPIRVCAKGRGSPGKESIEMEEKGREAIRQDSDGRDKDFWSGGRSSGFEWNGWGRLEGEEPSELIMIDKQ